jgi:acetyl-CoA acetyltransferase family protein
MKSAFGVDSMPETAENVAAEAPVTRQDQDAFALRSQQRAAKAQASGRFAAEIVGVPVKRSKKAAPVDVEVDEQPRPETTLEALAALPTPFRAGGSVTAGNSSGVNDGAAALIVASEAALGKYGLTPRARIVAAATAGVAPRVMGVGPVPAVQKLLALTGRTLGDIELIELNEAFAAQSLAVLRRLGLPDDAAHVNPNGGAIALGHPLGMSGARLALTASVEMQQQGLKNAICTMCIGVGQGIAMLLERV